jgi:peptide/nickel transport system substrate-binding protein
VSTSCGSNSELLATPELALSWVPNADASRWTVKLRPNVKFQTGQPMAADDVVATYKLLTDPSKGSAALADFKGVLTPDGVLAGPDQDTAIFALETPTAFFPYLISSTAYQTIILPATYKIGTFTATPQGTGPFIMTSYTTTVSATYDRNGSWWGGTPPLQGVDATVYQTNAALDAALLSGTADLADYAGDSILFGKPQVQAVTDQQNYARQLEEILLHDTPNLILAWPGQTDAGSPRVRGFSPEPFGLSLGHVSLAS